MSNRATDRICAGGGVAYVVFSLIGSNQANSEPTHTSSTAEIGRWFAQHHTDSAHYALAFLTGVGLIALIPFAAALWRPLRDAEGDRGVLSMTMLGAAFVWVGLKLASAAPEFALHWRSPGLSAQLAAALVDMGSILFVITWLVEAVMLGAAAVIVLRTRVLPRWLGLLAAVTAVVQFASVPVANHVPPVGMLLTLLWVFLASLVLVVRGERAATVVPVTA
jgi:hypothetical protein